MQDLQKCGEWVGVARKGGLELAAKGKQVGIHENYRITIECARILSVGTLLFSFQQEREQLRFDFSLMNSSQFGIIYNIHC